MTDTTRGTVEVVLRHSVQLYTYQNAYIKREPGWLTVVDSQDMETSWPSDLIFNVEKSAPENDF